MQLYNKQYFLSGGDCKLLLIGGRWSIGSGWTSWIQSDKDLRTLPECGWWIRTCTRERKTEFVLDTSMRLRMGPVRCDIITISSSGPVLRAFGQSFLGRFHKDRSAYKAGRPVFRNDFGQLLSMTNMFSRVKYWTVHNPDTLESFRLNLRRNTCPALLRGTDNLYLIKSADHSEN